MYYRSRGTRSFVIYLLVVVLALVIGLMLGAAYPDQINNFFPSIGESVNAYFENLFGTEVGSGFAAEETDTVEPMESPAVPGPTESPAPVQAGSGLLPPRPTPQTCVVTTGYGTGTINIRSGPGHTYAVVGTAREGDVLTFTGKQNEQGWAPILTSDGLSGYFYIPSWCE